MNDSQKNQLLRYWREQSQREKSDIPRLSTQEEIEDFESHFSLKLPNFFKTYLLECGIASFNDIDWKCSVYTIDIGEKKYLDYVMHNYIRNLSQIEKELHNLNNALPDYWGTNAPLIPSQMIPIGDSLSSDNGYLLMNLSNDHYGSLWHWRFIQDAWGSEDNNAIIRIADSFEQWLDDLKSCEEAEKIVQTRGGE
ncbi:hypothetical protein BCT30_05260 [Enterovibrio norvegicus]|uniref:SMI1 / KNR4 family (SUKH-1) n=2 Tax=Enterovibrio norvegicus TaxID=188144 RepID=A0A1I5NJ85_9GAMM|nr:SMI1/KNR4 family protein [Enterovibrio norvegicus]MCC4800238.1 SMI1/KNR4 family protein [Enterovibrio norvegicus]OEE62332.1 hypothetical protein A1OS_18180 [Enterovibrio norvegicus]OEF48766.1 hypothetical protein A1OW_14475 [Enterovibrio norvegicus]OEF55179.1 hypothetical protein A1OU_22630 [Enterovibrio norvegicus]PMI28533.1 hypothetical protein BCU47_21210 [Enterovibrio norvegicus]